MCLQSLMKFHRCLFKILRKNQNVVDKELQREITLTELSPSPYFSTINVHLVKLWISMCLPNFMKFCHCLFKILKNQNVADGRNNRRTDGCENSIPPQTQFAGGIKKLKGGTPEIMSYVDGGVD